MATKKPDFLDPKVLNKITRLDLKARHIVEGFVAGMHKSPYHGFSVEFAEHREYTPGDDLKHLDWKVFGRSDRLFIKEYELETNLRSHILLDCSESMDYGSGDSSKLELACLIAASMAHLILRQQDAVGIALFDDRVRNLVPPSSSPSHLQTLLGALDSPKLEEKTDVGAIFHEFADRIKKKALILVVSDLFDDIEHVKRGLKHLRYKNHEVIVFHVLDHDELTFPFQRMTLFEGLESLPELLANPQSLRDAYLEEIGSFLGEVRKVCRDNRIDYVKLDTEDKLDVALSAYLAARAGSLRS